MSFNRRALAAIAASIAMACPAGAKCLDPSLSVIPECIPITPDGSLEYTVTILCPWGPVPDACVSIEFTQEADDLLCWCEPPLVQHSCFPQVVDPPHRFAALSDANGQATFVIRGSGCLEKDDPAIPGTDKIAARVYVDGVLFRECGVVSPDFMDGAGRSATDTPSWDPEGVCAVGLTDGVGFTMPIANGTWTWCADLNGDGSVGLSDATILTPSVANAISCSEP
jgi:hypothetical protein